MSGMSFIVAVVILEGFELLVYPSKQCIDVLPE
jgi:hypothetical protein